MRDLVVTLSRDVSFWLQGPKGRRNILTHHYSISTVLSTNWEHSKQFIYAYLHGTTKKHQIWCGSKPEKSATAPAKRRWAETSAWDPPKVPKVPKRSPAQWKQLNLMAAIPWILGSFPVKTGRKFRVVDSVKKVTNLYSKKTWLVVQ